MSEPTPPVIKYKLPTTIIRVAGTVTKTTDEATAAGIQELKALATTEVVADVLSSVVAPLRPPRDGTSAYVWKLHPDGRLKEVSLDATINRLGGLATVAKVGSFVASVALPLLIPGPAGLIASVTALAASSKSAWLLVDTPTFGKAKQDDPVLARYADASAPDAEILVELRRSVYLASKALAEALQTNPPKPDELVALEQARRALKLLRPDLERAEARFQAWRISRIQTEVTEFNETFPIESLPTADELAAWHRARPQDDKPIWANLFRTHGVGVSVDLVPKRSNLSDVAAPVPLTKTKGLPWTPDDSDGTAGSGRGSSPTDLVWWRPPRRLVLRVWRLEPEVVAKLVSESEINTPAPGNEEKFELNPTGNSGKTGLVFDDSGALVEATASLTGRGQQLANDWSNLITGASEGADAGKGLRDALALPSLKDQVEAKEALAKLAPSEPENNEVTAAKKELEAAQQRARLNIAEQLANATTPPQIIVYATAFPPSDG